MAFKKIIPSIFVLLLFIGASQGWGQTTSIDELYENTQSLSNEIQSLQAEAQELSGERQASLDLRIVDRQLELLAAFDALASRIKSEEANEDNDLDAIKEKLAPQLLQLGPRIKAAIARRLAQLDAIDDSFTPLSIEWLAAFADNNQFIDNAYHRLTRHAKNLADLNLNNTESKEFLTQALPQRAEILAGQIELTQRDLDANVQHLTNSPDDTEIQQKVKSLQNKLAIITQSLKNTINQLTENELESHRYKELLIRSTGDITADILDVGLVTRLTKSWLNGVSNYLLENSAAFFFKALIFLLILLAFHYLSRTIAKLLRKSLAKATMPVSSLMEDMLVKLCGRLVMLIGVLIGLGQLGFSLGPILAGLGVAGFIVGFALQDTLGNFASGMMILIYRPYDVDDLIEAAGVMGRVQRMNLVSTTILTIDNQTLMIPNNKIWGDVIRNVTAQKHRRVDMVFGIGYQDDIEKAERILKDILKAHPLVLDEPEMTVKLHTLNESSVDFIVRPWVNTENYWDVYWDVTKSVKLRFDAEGVSIPFPQRDVHIYQTVKNT